MNILSLITPVGTITVGVAIVWYWKVKARQPMKLFFMGALFWFIAVVLKVIIAVLGNKIILSSIEKLFSPYVADPLKWIYIGLLTGIFECGVILIFLCFIRKNIKTWNNSLAVGLGFGAIESIMVGLESIVIILLVILIPEHLPKQILEYASGSGSLLDKLHVIVERIITIPIHAFATILVIFAIINRQWKWFWLSFIYKTAVDSLAACYLLSFKDFATTSSGAWITETTFLPFGIIGVIGIIYLFKKKQLDMNVAQQQQTAIK